MAEKKEIKHILIPKHEKLSASERKKILEQYNTDINALPKILITDPALRGLDVKAGDLVKITRKSPTSGESFFYRGVISE